MADGAVSRAVSIIQDRREFLSVHRRQFQLHYADVLSSIAKARIVATKKK